MYLPKQIYVQIRLCTSLEIESSSFSDGSPNPLNHGLSCNHLTHQCETRGEPHREGVHEG